MSAKVSVIVTCYNHEAYIEQCIRSIYSQTYSNIELIIMDDGSTDNSLDIIKKLVKESPFGSTEYYSGLNQGICKIRNKALNMVSGDFFLFVDSDNYLEDNYIEVMINTAEKNNADIIYTDLVNPDNGEVFVKGKEFELKDFLTQNYIDSCSLVRKSKIGDACYDEAFNRLLLEDYDFFANLIINKNCKAKYTSQTHLNYRVLRSSKSRQENRAKETHFYNVYLDLLKKYSHDDLIFSVMSNHINTLAGRLVELIEHLSAVQGYINELNTTIDELKVKSSESQIENANLQNELDVKSLQFDDLLQEYQYVTNARSYKVYKKIKDQYKLGKKVLYNPGKALTKSKALLGLKEKKIKNIVEDKLIWINQIGKSKRRNQLNAVDKKRCLIFVIYEPSGNVQEYKKYFLKNLAGYCSKIIIIVNGSICENDKIELLSYGQIILRDNQGYDVMAYKEGYYEFLKLDIGSFSDLLFVNDTSIGPIGDFSNLFQKMDTQDIDFWGITEGELQSDVTGINPHGFIPHHIQSYFIDVKRSLFLSPDFKEYWDSLIGINNRNDAIGKHETVFTKYFFDKGYKYSVYCSDCSDSAVYIHPLRLLKEGCPIIKYTALSNYDDKQFLWSGLVRSSEIPELLQYVEKYTNYPVSILTNIIQQFKNQNRNQFVLIVDGVENIIPQCTRYRVFNKVEQLNNNGIKAKSVGLTQFKPEDLKLASAVIIYRAPYDERTKWICSLARTFNKKVYFDIDDLVVDTKYTNQLSYVQQLSLDEKRNYDAGVISYHKMMLATDSVITSTTAMKRELETLTKKKVLINRNVVNQELIEISKAYSHCVKDNKIRIGYFSGSITHNENFELIKDSILKILSENPHIELHLVGHLTIPKELEPYKNQLVFNDYVDWKELPKLIGEMDINLAPLVNSIFNEAKSEIKWLEAALVKVPTIASNIGSFAEMIDNGKTGILANDDEWYQKLDLLVQNSDLRRNISEEAFRFVNEYCSTKSETKTLKDELELSLQIIK